MATTRITALTELAEVPADDDVFALEDISTGTTKKVTAAHVRSGLAATADLATVGAAVAAHAARTDNPHGVTAAQAGAIPATPGAATAYVSAASEAAAGISELATLTEAVTGTDTARVVTVAAARQAQISLIRDALGRFAGVVPPSLNLFCRDQASDAAPVGAFARSTSNFRLGQGGLLETVAAGSVRREWGADGTLYGWKIEETRTNLLTYSEQINTWTGVGASTTADATTAPDGNTTADMLVEDTSTGGHSIYKSISSVTAGKTYTLSVFAKSGTRSTMSISLYESTTTLTYFNLSTGTITSGTGTITPVGNGWYKCSVSFTPTLTTIYARAYLNDGSSNSYTGNGASGLYLWGAQVEAGAYASSYIPTTTAAVARSADVWTIALATTWFNAIAGTLFVAGRTPAGQNGSWEYLFSLDDGSATNQLRAYRDASRNIVFRGASGGSSAGSVTAGSVSDSSKFRLALSWGSSTLAAAVNGAAAVTGALSGVPGGLTTLRPGASHSGATQFGGHISHLAYFPQALSAAQLQAMTL